MRLSIYLLMGTFLSLLAVCFIIGLAMWAVDSVLAEVSEPEELDSSEEKIEVTILSKKFTPEHTTENLPAANDYATIYEDFTYIAPKYEVEMKISGENIVFDDESLYNACQVGSKVSVTIVRKVLQHKGMFKEKTTHTIELKSFVIKN